MKEWSIESRKRTDSNCEDATRTEKEKQTILMGSGVIPEGERPEYIGGNGVSATGILKKTGNRVQYAAPLSG